MSLTKTLVERLRVEYPNAVNPADAHEAANEIMALRAERHQLQNDLTAAGLENERLQKREKDLMDVIDSRDRALGFVPLDEVTPHEPSALSTEAELAAAFPAVAAAVIAEVEQYSGLSPKELAELAWSTLIDAAWGHTTMLYELCARVSPEWDREREAAKADPTPQKSNVCTCGRQATGDHEPGCAYRPDWL